MARDDEWKRQAACHGLAHLFFSPDGERGEVRARREQAAKAVCATCPVRRICLKTAVENKESGLWGGATDEERGYIRRRHRRQQARQAS
jgi:WhiB family redox-sensing transcriptional regulator